jgi:Putative auto-transporter adhesin, head GIN domain
MAIKSETRPVSGFDRLSAQYYGDVVLEQGDTEGLVIEADEELLQRIKSEVKDGSLTIGFDVQWWEWLTEWMKLSGLADKKINYKITMRQIKGISLSGAVNLGATKIMTEDCSISISGSAKVQIGHFEGAKLANTISGSGTIELAGSVQRHTLHVSGSGTIKAGDFVTQEADIHISGSAKALVKVAQTLNVHISGAGDVQYLGQPQVRQHISGVGRVRQVS